ncbi:MAG: 6-phosphofructokinase [Verrucomicrobia bacterium]|nr:6-phosphofructokinase [Cytophagales bacterium]
MKKIGVLTGGGDCPGLNAVIRAVTKTAILRYNYEVIGFEDGFLGLIENRTKKLNYEAASGILAAGGTILGTSNKANPFKFWQKNEKGEYFTTDESQTVLKNYREHNLDALVCIGGDGTFTIANGLQKLGMNVVGVPKTIDNDIYGTDQTFGFDTAVNTITEAIDKIQTTALAHHRAMVIEVMGRNAGWLALMSGVAGGADIILLPELEFEFEKVAKRVMERSKYYTVIVVAEGAKEKEGEKIIDKVVKDSPDPIRLGGIGKVVANKIEDMTGIESRVTVLGHLQRGGSPSPYDRILCTMFGEKAVQMIEENDFGKWVCWRNGTTATENLTFAAGRQRLVPVDHPLIETARSVGVRFGNE